MSPPSAGLKARNKNRKQAPLAWLTNIIPHKIKLFITTALRNSYPTE
jgi:hypothetical protein